eukprot:15436291-Alexandrium_andersonii.AAC.1
MILPTPPRGLGALDGACAHGRAEQQCAGDAACARGRAECFSGASSAICSAEHSSRVCGGACGSSAVARGRAAAH